MSDARKTECSKKLGYEKPTQGLEFGYVQDQHTSILGDRILDSAVTSAEMLLLRSVVLLCPIHMRRRSPAHFRCRLLVSRCRQ